MSIIVDKREQAENLILTFPGMTVEKVQLCSGNYHWSINLEDKTLDLKGFMLNADFNNVVELRRALTVFTDYLEVRNYEEEEFAK